MSLTCCAYTGNQPRESHKSRFELAFAEGERFHAPPSKTAFPFRRERNFRLRISVFRQRLTDCRTRASSWTDRVCSSKIIEARKADIGRGSFSKFREMSHAKRPLFERQCASSPSTDDRTRCIIQQDALLPFTLTN